MTKILSFCSALFVLWAMVACKPKDSRVRQIERLGEMEAEVLRDLSDTARIHALAKAYRDLADSDPKDTGCAEFLFKSGLLYRNIPGEGLRAVEAFRLLDARYPEHRLAPEAKFNEALAWEVDVEQRTPAAKAYSEFLNRYPEHVLVPVVRQQLELLQKDGDPLETIRRFEREAAEKTAGVEASGQ